MERINITKEIANNKSLAGHLVLEGLTSVLKDKNISDFVKKNETKDGVIAEITFQINGVDLPFLEFCEHWHKQVDRMIKEKAQEIIDEKFSDISDLAYDLQERLKLEVEKRMEDWEKGK